MIICCVKRRTDHQFASNGELPLAPLCVPAHVGRVLSCYLFWVVTWVCCRSPGHTSRGAPVRSVCREALPAARSGVEIYPVPPGIPSGAPLVNFGSLACCRAWTTILALVFDNSPQVVFHQLLFWFGSYGRNVSGCSAGVSRERYLLLLCNVTFQSVLGMKIMGCQLLFLLNFKGTHLLCGRSVWGVTLAWFCLEEYTSWRDVYRYIPQPSGNF